MAFHSGKAPTAASTALEASSAPEAGVVPRISEGLEGFTISEVSPESADVHSPPMKFRDSVWDSIKVTSCS